MDLHSKYEAVIKAITGRYRVCYLLFFSLCVSIVHLSVYRFPVRDTLLYLSIIQQWNRGGSYTQIIQEYPKFGLMLFTFLPIKWLNAAGLPLFPLSIVYMILLNSISILLFYKIVRMLTGDTGKAMWAGVLLSMHPALTFHAGFLMRDTPYLMFCLLTALLLIYVIRERRWFYFLLSGVSLALSLLSRYEAWEMLILFPVFSIFYMIRTKFKKKEVFLFILLSITGFFLMCFLAVLILGNTGLLFEKIFKMILSFFPKWMVRS